ncbi:MAG: lactonase family protein [Kiritimatiellia bacterium]
MGKRTFVLSLVLAAASFAGAATKSVGYVGASSGGKPGALHVVEVDNETGAVAVKGELPLADTTYIALNRARTRLYTTCSSREFGGKGANGGVAVYELDAAGLPTRRLDAVATTRGTPCHLSISGDERRLVFAEYGTGTAGWVALAADGTFVRDSLGVVESTDAVGPNAARQDRPHCHCARTTPDGKYVCVVDLGTDRVKIYSAADGSFVRDLVTTPAGGGPRHLVFHPNGRYAFLLFELENLVSSYRYEDGVFTPVMQLSLLPDDYTGFSKAAAIKLSGDGTELYCSNRGCESIAVFAVNGSNGHLRRRGVMKIAASFPWDFEFMPGGKVLAVGLMKDKSLRTYRYDKDACTLTPLAAATDMGPVFCSTFFPAN